MPGGAPDSQEGEVHNPYNEVELLIGYFFFGGVDLICFLLDFTGVGDFLTPFIQGFATFTMTMWARSKGDANAVKMGRQLVKYGSNIIPWLPTTLAAFAIESYLHNHPKAAGVAAKTAGPATPSARVAVK